MPIPITVPRLGWSMDEGTFVGWLKKDGESVKTGEPLFTLEGDKASQEVEAIDSGILRIPPDAPEAGSPVAVGAVLGYLVGENESLPATPRDLDHGSAEGHGRAAPDHNADNVAPEARTVETEHQIPAPVAPVGPSPVVRISPRARRRATELGIDCRKLKGSGRSGRITEADVLAATTETPVSSASIMRRLIAQKTGDSFARAPHFYLRTEVDVTALVALRKRLLPEIEQVTGIRLTLTDLLLRAQALALRECSQANAIWQPDGLVRFTTCDVGLVVGLADGLRVPILRRPDQGSLADLVKQRDSLVEAARTGTLAAEAMQGGATSLSNLGNEHVDEFAAVISPPQSSMLAVGRAAPRPFAVDGKIVVRTTLKLCLSVDHRVMDGGPASKYLSRVAALIENPAELIHG